MNSNIRIIINTIAQNVRALLNIFLSLYSSRVAMDALGHSDYGLYMLIAGVVSLLTYLVNALVVTTQRHLSYCYGEGDSQRAARYFSNSYLLHIVIGSVLVLLAVSLTTFIFDHHWLNVDPDRWTDAKYVYLLVVVSVFLTFVTSPFRALLVAHENIVYISVVDVLDGILKLGLVFLLYYIEEGRVVVYSAIMTFIILFHFLMLYIYSLAKYQECSAVPVLKSLDRAMMKQLAGFSSWTLYGMGCVYLRVQGLSVLLNRVFGTVINAAFGVGTQVFSSVQNFSQAILNAMSPQIVQAEGRQDRTRMFYLSACASRYSFLLLSMIVVPLSFEMESILTFWLGDVPAYAVLFCRVFLWASLLDQLTIGLNVAIQAIGRLGAYSLVVYTLKVLTLPAIWIGLRKGYSMEAAMSLYVLFELASALVRFPFLKRIAGLDILAYLQRVFVRVVLPVVLMFVVCWLFTCCVPDSAFRFLLTAGCSLFVGVLGTWIGALDTNERQFVLTQIAKYIKK